MMKEGTMPVPLQRPFCLSR